MGGDRLARDAGRAVRDAARADNARATGFPAALTDVRRVPDTDGRQHAKQMMGYPHDRRTFLAAGIGAAVGFGFRPAPRHSQDLARLTLAAASRLLKSRSASAVALTPPCPERIE